jgi:serine/threonine protein phosphatase PrpC
MEPVDAPFVNLENREKVETPVEIYGHTDVGYSKTVEKEKEKINQDAFFIDKASNSAVVCDGLSGSSLVEERPAEAAKLAGSCILEGLKSLKEKYSSHEIDALKDEIVGIFQRTSTEVSQSFEVRGASTTALGCRIISIDDAPHAVIVNRGDSRAFLFHEDSLTQLTTDEATIRRWIDDDDVYRNLEKDFGFVHTDEDLAQLSQKYPNLEIKMLFWNRNRMYGSIPGGEYTEQGEYLSPEIQIIPLQAGDKVLLACDGITDNSDEDEIRNILAADVADPAQVLIDSALKNSIDETRGYGRKPDNVTAVVVSFGDVEHKQDKTNNAPTKEKSEEYSDAYNDVLKELRAKNKSPFLGNTMRLFLKATDNPNLSRNDAKYLLSVYEQSEREKGSFTIVGETLDREVWTNFWNRLEELKNELKDK